VKTVRILLDENMPKKLRQSLFAFEVFTTQYAGFGGLKNGELLNAAEAAGFDVLLTGDRSLEYEQNMAGRKIAVVAISAPHWRVVKDHVDRIALAIEGAAPGTFTRVDVGVFVRRKHMPGANLE
jgi:hypothetical protein